MNNFLRDNITTLSGDEIKIKIAKGGKILLFGNKTICDKGIEIKMAEGSEMLLSGDEIICEKGIKIKMPTDKDWQEQQVEDKEMAAIKGRGDIKREEKLLNLLELEARAIKECREGIKKGWIDYMDIIDYLDTIKYMNAADYMDMKKNCNTKDLMRLLEAEILIYNMESADG